MDGSHMKKEVKIEKIPNILPVVGIVKPKNMMMKINTKV